MTEERSRLRVAGDRLFRTVWCALLMTALVVAELPLALAHQVQLPPAPAAASVAAPVPTLTGTLCDLEGLPRNTASQPRLDNIQPRPIRDPSQGGTPVIAAAIPAPVLLPVPGAAAAPVVAPARGAAPTPLRRAYDAIAPPSLPA